MDQETFDGVVERLNALRSDGVRMNGLLVSHDRATFRHDFTGQGFPATDVRSISKVVVSLAVGAAIAAGVHLRGRPLSLDLEIAPFFAGHLHRRTAVGGAHWRDVRLRHLLTNTTGHEEGFLFRADLEGRDRESLLPYLFDHELARPPGSHFAYSNAGWYLISALVHDELGTTLSEWASWHVLRHLEIGPVTWVTYGRHTAAATGLHLSATDVHKVGELLLGDGRYRGRQIVPKAWIDAMRAPRMPASSEYDPPLRATAYGLGLWICDDGVVYCDGAGGQFLVVVPRTRTVVVALAEAGDPLTVSRCLRDAVDPGRGLRARP